MTSPPTFAELCQSKPKILPHTILYCCSDQVALAWKPLIEEFQSKASHHRWLLSSPLLHWCFLIISYSYVCLSYQYLASFRGGCRDLCLSVNESEDLQNDRWTRWSWMSGTSGNEQMVLQCLPFWFFHLRGPFKSNVCYWRSLIPIFQGSELFIWSYCDILALGFLAPSSFSYFVISWRF